MKQAIVILFDTSWDEKLESMRQKFVHYYNFIGPHISLIYTFEIKNQNEVKNHLKRTVYNFKSFKLKLNKFGKSAKDYYLYLLAEEGNEQLLELHSKLQRGIFANVINENMPKYIPHITMGIFDTEKEINTVINNPNYQNLSYETKVNKIHLVTFNDEYKIIDIEEFSLQ